jgi:hypothetical protein
VGISVYNQSELLRLTLNNLVGGRFYGRIQMESHYFYVMGVASYRFFDLKKRQRFSNI